MTSPISHPVLLQNLFIFQKENRTLYLNPEVPDWISIKDKYKGIFDRFDGSCSLSEIDEYICRTHESESGLLIKQIRNLLDNTLIFQHNGHVGEIGNLTCTAKRFEPKYIYLTLTDACNLKCTYCYAKDRIQTETCKPAHWFSFIRQIHQVAQNLYFNFTGGEPLLVPFVFNLAEHIKSLGSSCILLTNGVKIDSAATAQRIARCFDEVKISLDSIDETTNRTLRGPGVLKAVERARQLLMRYDVKVTVVATITQQNIHQLREFCQHFDQKVSFQPLYRIGSARGCNRLTISGDRYYQTLKEAGILTLLPGYSSGIHGYTRNPYKRCAFGIEELSIAPNGDLYPCHMLHYPEMRIGNLKDETFETFYNESPLLDRLRQIIVDSLPQCKGCEVRNFCGGGCRARVDVKKSGILGHDEFCTFEKNSILDALLFSYP